MNKFTIVNGHIVLNDEWTLTANGWRNKDGI